MALKVLTASVVLPVRLSVPVPVFVRVNAAPLIGWSKMLSPVPPQLWLAPRMYCGLPANSWGCPDELTMPVPPGALIVRVPVPMKKNARALPAN